MNADTQGTVLQDHTAGTVLFEQGSKGSTMYVIESGSVEIVRTFDGKKHIVAVLTPGDFFGEMAIVSRRPRSATAVIREDARLLAIEEKTLSAMLRDKVEIAARLIKTLVTRLEQSNRKLEILLWYSESSDADSSASDAAATDGQADAAAEAKTEAASGEAAETPAAEDPLTTTSSSELTRGFKEATTPALTDKVRFDALWANITDVIINKDYRTALEYLAEAESLRPGDPKVAKYRLKLETLSEWADQAYDEEEE